jgi:hypothetical protein
VSAPVLAGALDALLHPPRDDRTGALDRPGPPARPERLVIAVAAVVSLVGLAVAVPHTSARPGSVPLGLDRRLDRMEPGTKVLNDYALGGWIAWRHPDLNQYIDGLATPYSPQHDDDFHTMETLGPGWNRLVARSGVTVALLQSDTTLKQELERRGWRFDGSDDGYTLLLEPDRN